jgi:arylsulfatase A-like enzyme
LIDVVPTVLEYVGISFPDHLQGESLLSAAANGDAGKRFVLSQWRQANQGALRIGNWKFYRRFAYSGLFSIGKLKFFYKERLEEELYDLKGDPGEAVNLASSASGIRDEIKRRLAALESMSDALWDTLPEDGAVGLKIDAATIQQLQALGYL